MISILNLYLRTIGFFNYRSTDRVVLKICEQSFILQYFKNNLNVFAYEVCLK